eukprot:CAMPEP_0204833966 /NCGR_PEP_ID=MMETSP1346-20131115/18427_1 /ASSEMBLY_ACC=CAM_ASM_000771 /TAXON_ID=215587 /ORGANISM="Aplanochytrium stocchinoi, Strain GSBS06" /LENGTH=181 /DNA_ID=CAMNT_0051966925 /DNA_START=102 /DNA_END=648 /DNA_ORIENTATION=-
MFHGSKEIKDHYTYGICHSLPDRFVQSVFAEMFIRQYACDMDKVARFKFNVPLAFDLSKDNEITKWMNKSLYMKQMLRFAALEVFFVTLLSYLFAAIFNIWLYNFSYLLPLLSLYFAFAVLRYLVHAHRRRRRSDQKNVRSSRIFGRNNFSKHVELSGEVIRQDLKENNAVEDDVSDDEMI